MIVYIIGGKTHTVRDALEYIADRTKTAKIAGKPGSDPDDLSGLYESLDFEEYRLLTSDSINRTLNYISNKQKVGSYISGYLCSPELAEEQFWLTKKQNLSRVGKSVEDDTGNYFYHIIQSFPEELDISDDEVHRCGIELAERLGLYQAVIASHVHPSIDEKGEARGKCKHNHIVINSHIYHEFIDPKNPHKMKYNDCKASYAQLQLINDQIAIEHGLPIVVNESIDRHYSWYEAEMINKGKSWKERVRVDINNAMRTSLTYEAFLMSMREAGYLLRIGHSNAYGEYITYTCPDGAHKVRDYTLGKNYTKAALEAYWELKKAINEDLLLPENTSPQKIPEIIEKANGSLYIKFQKHISPNRQKEIRGRNLNIRNTYTNYFPLSQCRKVVGNAELSYFDPQQTYEIVDQSHTPIATVTGSEVLTYFNQLHDLERAETARQKKEMENACYSQAGFVSSALNSPYKVRIWDENGRKRSMLELIILLAIVTIQNENGKWESKFVEQTKTEELQRHPIYARRDWKVQNMIETIRIAREEEVENPVQLEEKIAIVGKEIGKSKAEVRRLTAAKNRMDTLLKAIERYRDVKEICEKIQAMPDGPEKTGMQQKHAAEIEAYKENKSLMYRHEVTSEDEIDAFLVRYDQMTQRLSAAEAQLTATKQHYRQLSKLQYRIQLAQNKQFCYGPEYDESKLSATHSSAIQNDEFQR